ncbi:histidine phosphatase family protein [Nocardiopsis terrae]|uniref:Broad specificity phosphatase PhoE n=1 Tax=Nocardiopsis terrae TaxID=372655 RepID=A0ABR9HBA2_9ACTN|nr:histidine phosphatase family protein [Nocardiopsis terrae]MBE1456105.1 broad specificity phosphatase PhoE [Nocardiopsis terrae]GHC95854.1 histidine phosphatase family protein [Nocardiopsis terrae]
MTTTTVVHLLRHGEVYNPERVLYGRLPGYHLSDRGQQMAEMAADWFEGHDIAALFSSPLDRTQETAVPLQKAFDLPVTLDDRLIESDNKFEGMALSARSARDPRVLRRLYNPFKPSWGEPYQEIVSRMVEVIKAVRRAAWGREAVCVSHQLPIWTARRAAESKRLWHRPDQRECNLASVTSLTFTDQKLVSVSYAEPAAALYGDGPSLPGA